MYSVCDQLLTRLQLLCTLDQGEVSLVYPRPAPRKGLGLRFHGLVWICRKLVISFSSFGWKAF